MFDTNVGSCYTKNKTTKIPNERDQTSKRMEKQLKRKIRKIKINKYKKKNKKKKIKYTKMATQFPSLPQVSLEQLLIGHLCLLNPC